MLSGAPIFCHFFKEAPEKSSRSEFVGMSGKFLLGDSQGALELAGLAQGCDSFDCHGLGFSGCCKGKHNSSLFCKTWTKKNPGGVGDRREVKSHFILE